MNHLIEKIRAYSSSASTRRRRLSAVLVVLGLCLPACTMDMGAACEGEECERIVQVEQEAIYGTDNRKDYFETTAQRQGWADGVALMITRDGLACTASTCSLNLVYPDLCPGQKFGPPPQATTTRIGQQKVTSTGGSCSSFLVAPDLVATAGHCLDYPGPTPPKGQPIPCSEMRFVFGFTASTTATPGVTQSKSTVPPANVFSCKQIIYDPNAPDVAIIQLDRAATGRPVLPIRRTAYVGPQAPLVLIGHPDGLPLKVADVATVTGSWDPRVPDPDQVFYTSLDAFGGNSGSPVLNRDTGTVEGILIEGNEDYLWRTVPPVTTGCWAACEYPDATGQCSTYYPDGEKVARSVAIARQVPFVSPRNLTAGTSLIIDPTYTPLRGDFDKDGRIDLFMYGVGTAPDHIHWGSASRTTRFSVAAMNSSTSSSPINQSRRPASGDFDGDGADDILWYGTGANADVIWWGGGARQTPFPASRTFTQAGNLTPVVGDFDGNGGADVLWYGPGAEPDSVWWSTLTRGAGVFSSTSESVTGADFKPFAGDFDGDGYSDVYWYSTTATDRIWWGAAAQSFAASRKVNATMPSGITASFKPFPGDFDGDGVTDIFWYAPGSVAGETDKISWYTRQRTFVATNRSVSGTYTRPISGDFDGDSADDIVWYKAGTGSDPLWYGRLK